MSILIFQHDEREGPGLIGTVLRDHGFRLDIRTIRTDGCDPIPHDLDNVHGIVSLGGPASVTRPEPWMVTEMQLMREAHEREIPVLGVCLGHQLLAKALGGDVTRAAETELGYHPVDLSIAGQTETITKGVPWRFMAYQSHYDEVVAPPGSTVLATSPGGAVQMFQAGIRSLGVQFHFEYTRERVGRLVDDYPEFYAKLGLTKGALAEQADEHHARFAEVAQRLIENFVTYAFPFDRLLAT